MSFKLFGFTFGHHSNHKTGSLAHHHPHGAPKHEAAAAKPGEPVAAPKTRSLGTDTAQLSRGTATLQGMVRAASESAGPLLVAPAARPATVAAAPAPAASRAVAPPAAPSVSDLQNQIKQAIGAGANVQFSSNNGANWSSAELAGVLQAVKAMSPGDRALLANASFVRTDQLASVGGAAVAGTTAFGSNDKGGPVTISFANAGDTDSGLGQDPTSRFAQLAAHEFGHVALGGGRWDADQLREFAKLSHWQHPDGSLLDGYDKDHNPLEFDPNAKPLNQSNLVGNTKLSGASAEEDYAEAYRLYTMDPKSLLAQAPDKFAFINASSGKYNVGSQGQVVDPSTGKTVGNLDPLVLAELKNSNLQPETLAKIASQFPSGSGDPGTGAGDAISLIQKNSGDANFISKLQQDPAGALGSIWGRLSPAEQGLLKNPGFLNQVVSDVKANAAAGADPISSNDAKVLQGFFSDLVNNGPAIDGVLAGAGGAIGGFFGAIGHDIGALFGGGDMEDPVQEAKKDAFFDYFKEQLQEKVIPNVSPGLADTLKADIAKGKSGVLYELATNGTLFGELQKAWDNPSGPEATNLGKAISHMGPAETQAWGDLVKGGSQSAADNFSSNVAQMAQSGMYTDPTKIWGA